MCQHFLVSGKVQGVFFRACTADKATEIGLTGIVRNLCDGRVEIYAAGSAQQLSVLNDWLYQGSPASEVTGVLCAPAGDADSKFFANGFRVLRD